MAASPPYDGNPSNPLTETFLAAFTAARTALATGAQASTWTDTSVTPNVTYKDEYGAW